MTPRTAHEPLRGTGAKAAAALLPLLQARLRSCRGEVDEGLRAELLSLLLQMCSVDGGPHALLHGGVLRSLLENAATLLNPGGRLAVITFHSLEDRMVKQFFRHASKSQVDRKEWPEPRPNPDFCYKLLTRRPVIAGASEIKMNKRSRSAKLRVVEKI